MPASPAPLRSPLDQWTVVMPPIRPARPAYPPPRPIPAGSSSRVAEVARSAAAALVALLMVGLGLLGSNGGRVLWLERPAWSAVGTVAVIALLAGLFAEPPAALWRIQVGASIALTVVWLVLGLPVLASDIGCALTVGMTAAAVSVITSPHRPPRTGSR